MSYQIPQWRVVLDGTDLTERIAPRLRDLTLTECRGGDADQLDLSIHDHDGKMALPKRGVRLAVALGWKATGLVDKGTFIVDEVEYSGAPDIITVVRVVQISPPTCAHAANAAGTTPRWAQCSIRWPASMA